MSRLFRLLTAPVGLLHLRRIEQRGNDRRRADPNRHAGFHQLSPPFLVTLRLVAHSILAIARSSRPYDGGGTMKRTQELKCVGA